MDHNVVVQLNARLQTANVLARTPIHSGKDAADGYRRLPEFAFTDEIWTTQLFKRYLKCHENIKKYARRMLLRAQSCAPPVWNGKLGEGIPTCSV